MNNLSDKYNDSNIGKHWEVDKNKSSFERLLNHLRFTTKNYDFFSSAILKTLSDFPNGEIVVVDLGAGVGWTSAIMSLDPRIKKIYVIEPTEQRLSRVEKVVKYFGGDLKKIVIMNSTFTNFKLPEKVDIFVLHGSFHHCYDKDINLMFKKIKQYLKHSKTINYKDFLKRDIELKINSKILISGEHFLNRYILLWRLLKKIFLLKKSNKDIDNYSGEHNRYQKEIKKIFNYNNFKYKFYYFDGDMIDPMLLKKNFLKKIFYKFNIQALYYYYSILELKK